MTAREKLVELLCDGTAKTETCDLHQDCATAKGDCGFCTIMADHLIANGVTVQECGHWNIIMDDYDCEMMQCSVCRSEFYDGENDTVDLLHNYCPYCGAKMLPEPPKGE